MICTQQENQNTSVHEYKYVQLTYKSHIRNLKIPPALDGRCKLVSNVRE